MFLLVLPPIQFLCLFNAPRGCHLNHRSNYLSFLHSLFLSILHLLPVSVLSLVNLPLRLFLFNLPCARCISLRISFYPPAKISIPLSSILFILSLAAILLSSPVSLFSSNTFLSLLLFIRFSHPYLCINSMHYSMCVSLCSVQLASYTTKSLLPWQEIHYLHDVPRLGGNWVTQLYRLSRTCSVLSWTNLSLFFHLPLFTVSSFILWECWTRPEEVVGKRIPLKLKTLHWHWASKAT